MSSTLSLRTTRALVRRRSSCVSLGLMRRLILVAFIAAIQSAVAKSADSPLGRAIEDIPEALRLIRTADDVYVLPVTLTEDRERRVTPRGDFRHLRPDRRRRPSKAAAFARHRKKLVPRVGRHHQRRLRPSHCWLHLPQRRRQAGFTLRTRIAPQRHIQSRADRWQPRRQTCRQARQVEEAICETGVGYQMRPNQAMQRTAGRAAF